MCVKACEMQHWCKETEKRSKRVRTTGRRRIETFEHFLFGDSHRNRFREKTMQQNRSPVSSDQSSFINLMPKRLKIDVPLSSKEKKEKFSERISALQQLVSPFGKTDTASVLLEAMDYINFLHEQVKVLGAPYLYSTPTETEGGEEPCSLKAKGLCLVPVSLTVGVVSSNGADIWAPIKTTTQNSKRLVWDEEASVVTHS